MSQAALYRLLLSYLERVPGAMVEVEPPKVAADIGVADTTPPSDSPTTPLLRCRYTPHSLRATTATLLDEAGVGIKKIQDLLGHRDIRVTQTYIKLGQDTRKSASHEVPL